MYVGLTGANLCERFFQVHNAHFHFFLAVVEEFLYVEHGVIFLLEMIMSVQIYSKAVEDGKKVG